MVKRIDPKELAREYAERGIVPDYDKFYFKAPNGQIRACVIGLLNIIDNSEIYQEHYLKMEDLNRIMPTKLGVGHARRNYFDNSYGYLFGLMVTFQPNVKNRTHVVLGHLLNTCKPSFAQKRRGIKDMLLEANIDEFAMGVEDAITLMTEVGLRFKQERSQEDNVKLFAKFQENAKKLSNETSV